MKFENRNTELKIVANENANYAELLLFLYKQSSLEGLTLNQIREDMKVMDVLTENLNIEEFEITSEAVESIKKIVSKSVWPIRHVDLVTFADYIDSL